MNKLVEYKTELINERVLHEFSYNLKELDVNNTLNYESKMYILGRIEAYLKALVDTEQMSEMKADDELELIRYELNNTTITEALKFYQDIDITQSNYWQLEVSIIKIKRKNRSDLYEHKTNETYRENGRT